jgi:membrane-associated phospholipid phosphatase
VLKRFIYVLICLLTLKAQAQQSTDTGAKKNIADTLKKDLFTAPDTVQHLHSKSWSLIPPAVLVGYGITSFYVKPLRTFDRYIYTEADERNTPIRGHVENYIQYAPVILTYGLNLVGVHGKNTFVDRTFTFVLAQGMMNLTLFTVKHATHRMRPDNSDRLSFPSGHTSNAFLGAEFMSQELSGKSAAYGAIGYAFATTTGVLRIYHQDHWLSDVIAGAGLGILSAKGAYLLYPYIRNGLFNGDKQKAKQQVPGFKEKPVKSTILLPSYQDGALGLQFAMQL